MQSTSSEILGWMSTCWNQDARRNINNLRYEDDTTLVADGEEELKSLLMKVKKESENIGLKLNIQKTKITASGPITSWQIDGETMETVRDFIFLASKISAYGDCSHEIKRCLLFERKAMTILDSILKSRDITLSTKVCPVVMYGCELSYKESWVLMNWCFWTVVLEKTLESPLACKEIQSILISFRTDAQAEAPIAPDYTQHLSIKPP